MSVALARPMSLDTSPGEIGGIFAGIVAILVAAGHGVKWLINWNDARISTRSAKLEAWEARLVERETEFEARIDARLKVLEAENRSYRLALSHVIPALRTLDPDNPSLRMADEALRTAYPIDPRLPPDMQSKIDKLGDVE